MVPMIGSAWAKIETRPTAFIHANLIPMTSASILPDHTVVVEGRRIAAMGPAGQIRIPSDFHLFLSACG